MTKGYLRGCGFSEVYIRELVADSMQAEREKAAGWLDGEKSREGKDKADAIRWCGRLKVRRHPCGRMTVFGEQCRERACPRCQVKRARLLGAELRTATMERVRDDGAPRAAASH